VPPRLYSGIQPHAFKPPCGDKLKFFGLYCCGCNINGAGIPIAEKEEST